MHYHFEVPRDTFLAQVEEGKFLEHAHVHGNVYGSSFAAVEAVKRSGKVCVLDIDVQGAENVKRSPLGAVFLFISPPSMEELERRLRGRGTESEDKIAVRLANAQKELAKPEEDPSFFDAVLVNRDLEECYAQMKAFISDKVVALSPSE